MKSAFKKAERHRLSDLIIKQILAGIETGRLKTGSKLPAEPVLMREFGVGRNTVREAIGALSLIGVVDVKPGSGTHIADLSGQFLGKSLRFTSSLENEKIEELIGARIALEEALVGLAAENATTADCEELREIVVQLNQATRNRKRLLQLDLAFHFRLAKAAHNEVLMRFLEQLRRFMHVWIEQVTASMATARNIPIIQQHENILRSIEGRDKANAQRVLREHLKDASRDLKMSLVERRLRNRI